MDSGKSCFLVLLDLSAAFDTISHSRLLSILESSFGITGQALSWIKSYLAGRSIKIKAESSFSSVKHSNIGVPQDSVLGPLLFNCIMARLLSILESICVQCHLYVDDTQFLITFDRYQESSARDKVLMAFEAIKKFRSTSDFHPLQLDSNVSVCPSYSTHNLGVILDSKLSFKKQYVSSDDHHFFT